MRRSNRCLSENRVGTPGFGFFGLPRTAADEVAVTIYFEADEASFAGSDGCASSDGVTRCGGEYHRDLLD